MKAAEDVSTWVALGILVFAVPLTSWFWSRRDKFPIKGRNPFVAVCVSGAFGILLINILLRSTGSAYPCLLDNALFVFGSQLAAVCYAVRTVQLLFRMEIADNLFRAKFEEPSLSGVLAPIDPDGPPSTEPLRLGHLDLVEGWYLRNRGVTRPSFSTKCVAFQCTFCLVLLVLSASLEDGMHTDIACEATHDGPMVLHVINTTMLALYTMIATCAAYKLKDKQEDGFMIKSELQTTGAMALLFILVASILSVLYHEEMQDYYIITFIAEAMALVSLSISVVMPLHRSYREEAALQLPDDLNDLSSVLASRVGFEAFLAFLKTEYSTENLLFWDAVNKFKSHCASDNTSSRSSNRRRSRTGGASLGKKPSAGFMRHEAEHICTSYIESKAPMSINIEESLRQKTLQSVKASWETGIDPLTQLPRPEVPLSRIQHIFDKAQTEIFELMCSNSFDRFAHTPAFTQLHTKMTKRRRLEGTNFRSRLNSYDKQSSKQSGGRLSESHSHPSNTNTIAGGGSAALPLDPHRSSRISGSTSENKQISEIKRIPDALVLNERKTEVAISAPKKMAPLVHKPSLSSVKITPLAASQDQVNSMFDISQSTDDNDNLTEKKEPGSGAPQTGHAPPGQLELDRQATDTLPAAGTVDLDVTIDVSSSPSAEQQSKQPLTPKLKTSNRGAGTGVSQTPTATISSSAPRVSSNVAGRVVSPAGEQEAVVNELTLDIDKPGSAETETKNSVFVHVPKSRAGAGK